LPAQISIGYLNYDSSDEWISIDNTGGRAQVMTGWRIVSVVGPQTYTFPSGYSLAAGGTVYVHSGAGAYSSPPGDLLWTKAYIWNNDGDKAVLYNAASQSVDSYCYRAGCP
jgi:competence protein ComEC